MLPIAETNTVVVGSSTEIENNSENDQSDNSDNFDRAVEFVVRTTSFEAADATHAKMNSASPYAPAGF